MHREGSEGERKKCYLSKKMKRGDTQERIDKEPRRGLVLPTRRAEYSLLHSLGLNCVVISTLAICIGLFIYQCVRVDNQSNLPP